MSGRSQTGEPRDASAKLGRYYRRNSLQPKGSIEIIEEKNENEMSTIKKADVPVSKKNSKISDIQTIDLEIGIINGQAGPNVPTRRIIRKKSKSQCHQTKSSSYTFPEETSNGILTKETREKEPSSKRENLDISRGRKLARQDSAKNSGQGRILCNKKDASTPARNSRLSTEESGSKLKSQSGSLFARTNESKSPKSNTPKGCCVCSRFTTFCVGDSEAEKESNCEHSWHRRCRNQFMETLEIPGEDKKAKLGCPMCLIKTRLFDAFGSDF
jgi:hypothetical protein